MKKILILGSGGAGKSTLARRLGEHLQMEVIHLDSYYWKPGWIETPKPEWRQVVARLTEGESWVMDGNYSGTIELRIGACDTVILLDIPRTTCLWRVIKRAVAHRGHSRPDMAEGCPEQINLEFLKWIWNYPKRTRPKILKLLEQHQGEKQIIRLRSRKDVAEFLKDPTTPLNFSPLQSIKR